MKIDPCFKGWNDPELNTAGRCCCNCRYQRPIVGHPWNKNELTKGSITRTIGYGCNAPELESTVFFDFEHSMCEMHDFKDNVHQLKRVEDV
jgi:hypothetical protein